MGGLRRLRRRSADRYEAEPLRGDLEAPYWEPEDWKLSTRILEIAKPLTDKAVDNDEFEAMVRMAALCWNVALLPADQQERRLRSLVDDMMTEREPEAMYPMNAPGVNPTPLKAYESGPPKIRRI